MKPGLYPALLALLCGAAHASPPMASPIDRPALQTARAQHALTLGVARAGSRLVAVGERGVVLLSDDDGRAWRQVPVPVSVTLTAVRFADAQSGWALGHGGVVLHSRDGGGHWTRQLDGREIIDLLKRPGPHRSAAAEKQLQQLVLDGPDKPLLDLYVKSEKEVFVVGAYGLALRTDDGGTSWTPILDRFDNPKGLHLNAISGFGDVVVVVGEQGLVQRSSDGGARFTSVAMPYNGSFFAVHASSDNSVIVAGLRGQAFRSADGGASFQPLALPAPLTVNALATRADGGVLLANQAGMVFAAAPGASAATPLGLPPVPLMSSLVAAADGTFVAAGAYGPVRLEKSRAP
ncbi:YCF48-related protein [Variovorax sp. J22P271]|uniref:WD40/YVTN/BNR-like repeat-containing protein n=1 Tax=Variovorax davisae TaxID=3053515 RepID=UPI002574DC22|nr:YCF48-related protein [Variovorax sp. J22P271]MDM0032414.1 YCF48-related protein [Variovorax sp. J22P271]